MIVSLSQDKTAMIGLENGILEQNTAKCRVSGNRIFLSDKANKLVFEVDDRTLNAIRNKGFLMYCTSNPTFDFFKIKVTSS